VLNCWSGSSDAHHSRTGQAGVWTGACGGVHGTQEESAVLHDSPADRPLAALRAVQTDQDSHLLEPRQLGHPQEPHSRTPLHVRPILSRFMSVLQWRRSVVNLGNQGQSGEAIKLFQITPNVNDFQTFSNPGSWQPVGALKN